MKKDKEHTVEKRSHIDNSTLEEINALYPKFTINGVAYELGLTYITIETDYFDNPSVRKLIKEHGAEILSVILYFRMQMCQPNGWYCRTDGDCLEMLIEKCSFTLCMEEEKIREYYNILIERKIMFEISDKDGTYLTDTQQLYNFEILNNKRARDRARKDQWRNNNKGNEKNTNKKGTTYRPLNSTPSAPVAPIQENVPVFDFDSQEGTDLLNRVFGESHDTFSEEIPF